MGDDVKVAIDQEGLADALTGATTNPGVSEFNQILNREAVVAKSSPVAQRVAEKYDPPLSRDDFADDTEVTVDEQASLLMFHGKARVQEAATRLATVHAEAYLANRRALATRRYRQAVEELDEQIATLESQGSQTEALRDSLDEQRERLQVLQALASAQASVVDTTKPERCAQAAAQRGAGHPARRDRRRAARVRHRGVRPAAAPGGGGRALDRPAAARADPRAGSPAHGARAARDGDGRSG